MITPGRVAVAVVIFVSCGMLVVAALDTFGPPKLLVRVENRSNDFLRDGALILGEKGRRVPVVSPGETWEKEYSGAYARRALAVSFKRDGKADLVCRMAIPTALEPPCASRIVMSVIVEGDEIKWTY